MKDILLLPLSLGIGLTAIIFGIFEPINSLTINWTDKTELEWMDYKISDVQPYYLDENKNATTYYNADEIKEHIEELKERIKQLDKEIAITKAKMRGLA